MKNTNLVKNNKRLKEELDEVIGSLDRIFFPCSSNHDEMIGLLLLRAPNVRAILRDQATVAGRGVLAAPSQQDL